MMFDSDILRIISNDIKPEVGKVLISEPLLIDDYFGRSVVLLADENDDSFLGFVLNHKLDKNLSDFIADIDNDDIPLYIGGPVDQDVLYYIHCFDFVKGAIKIGEGLYMDGDIDDIRELVNSKHANNSNIKFFLGNSGWASGQLNEEIIFNSWLVAKYKDNFVFEDPCNMWRNSLDFVDKRYRIWKNFPVDPELN